MFWKVQQWDWLDLKEFLLFAKSFRHQNWLQAWEPKTEMWLQNGNLGHKPENQFFVCCFQGTSLQRKNRQRGIWRCNGGQWCGTRLHRQWNPLVPSASTTWPSSLSSKSPAMTTLEIFATSWLNTPSKRLWNLLTSSFKNPKHDVSPCEGLVKVGSSSKQPRMCLGYKCPKMQLEPPGLNYQILWCPVWKSPGSTHYICMLSFFKWKPEVSNTVKW